MIRIMDVSSRVFIYNCLDWLMAWGGTLFLFTYVQISIIKQIHLFLASPTPRKIIDLLVV